MNKYSIKTLATIPSYTRIRRYENNIHESIYQKLILKFEVQGKRYQVIKEMGREILGRGRTENFLLIKDEYLRLKRLNPFTQKNTIEGKQIKIYCNSNNPKDIDLNLDNERRTTNILIFIGSVLLLAGLYVFFTR